MTRWAYGVGVFGALVEFVIGLGVTLHTRHYGGLVRMGDNQTLMESCILLSCSIFGEMSAVVKCSIHVII